jgi:2-polyprenyl-3-methyl-5-hydroxy-6-metoxy-1,4-benzoquinol methylase
VTPKDHFSGQASDYARHRPRYPESLIRFVASQAPRKGRAWDCATGSGQCAVALAEYFENVIATDLSSSQLAHAEKHPRVTYRAATAEDSGVETSSVDAVTAAQAFHWFDFEKFLCRGSARRSAGGHHRAVVLRPAHHRAPNPSGDRPDLPEIL